MNELGDIYNKYSQNLKPVNILQKDLKLIVENSKKTNCDNHELIFKMIIYHWVTYDNGNLNSALPYNITASNNNIEINLKVLPANLQKILLNYANTL